MKPLGLLEKVVPVSRLCKAFTSTCNLSGRWKLMQELRTGTLLLPSGNSEGGHFSDLITNASD
jgi:hypothetical protein